MVFDQQRRRDEAQGQSGEDAAAFSLWLWLSKAKDWIVVHDVIPDRFLHIMSSAKTSPVVNRRSPPGTSLPREQGFKEGILVTWAILADGTKALIHMSLGNEESYDDWLEHFSPSSTVPGHMRLRPNPEAHPTQPRRHRGQLSAAGP